MMRQIKKRVTTLITSLLLAFAPAQTAAADGVAGTWDAPTTIFAFSSGYGGFYSTPFVPTSTCLWNMFFIDTTTPAGSAIFSLLVTAHATREKIVTVYYNVAGNGWCWVDRLDIYRP